MSVMRTSLAAVLALSFAAPAFADGATNSASPASSGSTTASSTPGYNPNQMVCRHEEVTGSRLAGPRICHTRQEWAKIDNEKRNGIDTVTARGDYKP